MQVRGTLVATAVTLAAAALFYAAENPVLPPPYATPSVTNHPHVIPQPAGAKLTVPPGFHIEVWADGFRTPRYMLLGPNQEIILADSARRPNGAVYVFEGHRPKKIIDGLYQPYGLAYHDGFLYVGESDSVKRYPYDSRHLTAGPGQEVVSLKGIDRYHWTRNLLIDRAGKKLYVAVGSGSNDDTTEDPRRAAINRYNLDGTRQEFYAQGTRNPVGIHWYPGTDTLWAGVEERDTLGDDLPPDYLTHIQEGGFYGWPFAYTGPHEDPINKGKAPAGLVQKTIVPDVLLGAHVAVLDFTFYAGNQFPAEYRGGAFVAEHGSWNRSKRQGYQVVYVPFESGKPSGPPRPIVTGWMLSPENIDVWGRPVAVLELPDGSLLISDDGGRKIWRLSYDGK
jgi:glucose/arabinose dehydrogenase